MVVMKIYTANNIIQLDKVGKAGEYVSLGEYQVLENKYSELFKLLERIDAIGQDLGYVNRFGAAIQSPDLSQLLADIREALK
jgi:hypothetical protein